MSYLDETGLRHLWNKILSLKLSNTTADGAPAHNAVYRGKLLGGEITDEQLARIKDGTFKDLYIGDYWTLGNNSWRIAAFDYYYKAYGQNGVGSETFTIDEHHVILIPSNSLGDYRMNANAANIRYANSEMYTKTLPNLYKSLPSPLNTNLALSLPLHEVNMVDRNVEVDTLSPKLALMTQHQLLGSKIVNLESSTAGLKAENRTADNEIFPIFNYEIVRYWFRDSNMWFRDNTVFEETASGITSCFAHYSPIGVSSQECGIQNGCYPYIALCGNKNNTI